MKAVAVCEDSIIVGLYRAYTVSYRNGKARFRRDVEIPRTHGNITEAPDMETYSGRKAKRHAAECGECLGYVVAYTDALEWASNPVRDRKKQPKTEWVDKSSRIIPATIVAKELQAEGLNETEAWTLIIQAIKASVGFFTLDMVSPTKQRYIRHSSVKRTPVDIVADGDCSFNRLYGSVEANEVNMPTFNYEGWLYRTHGVSHVVRERVEFVGPVYYGDAVWGK